MTSSRDARVNTTMDTTNPDTLNMFYSLDRKFRRACQQIRLLNNRIEDVQVRYDRAYKAGRRAFRYTLRLQLATLEGVRNALYEYACRRADQLEQLQEELISQGIVSDSSDESNSSVSSNVYSENGVMEA